MIEYNHNEICDIQKKLIYNTFFIINIKLLRIVWLHAIEEAIAILHIT